MHVPDHLLNDPTEAVAAAAAAMTIGAVVIRSRATTGRSAPTTAAATAGPATRDGNDAVPTPLLAHPDRLSSQTATAALVFALQMVNFPVLNGTSGHLLGGALAAALIGPRRALLAVSAVVVSQAVFFADGGLGALGVNLWLIAILPVALAALAGRFHSSPRGGPARHGASVTAAVLAPPAAALAFSGLWAIGGDGAVGTTRVMSGMVGTHLAIGVGEGLVTLGVLGIITTATRRSRVATHAPVWATALVSAGALSLAASSKPDGLERVAGDLGFAVTGPGSVLAGGPLEGYAVAGMQGWLSGSLAGMVGVVATCAVAAVLVSPLRARVSDRDYCRPA